MRFGTIGTNFIVKEFMNAGREAGNLTVSAVYSRKMETARSFAQQWGVKTCTTSIDELAESDYVDAVYIASPNKFHAEQAERMLRAGKHVLLEKPACPDAESFQRLLALAEENHVVLMEAMRPAYTPGFAALKAAIPRVGKVRRVSFVYCQYSSRYDAYKRGVVENAFNPAMCNGSLMDIGVYCVHGLAELFGLPEQITAFAHRLDNGLDAQGGALCRYPDMLADLSWSKIADHRRENEIQGEEGTLVFDSISNPKQIVFVGRDKSRTELYHDPDPEFFGMVHELRAFLNFAGGGEQFKEELGREQTKTKETLTMMDEIRRQTGIDFVLRQNGKEGPQ